MSNELRSGNPELFLPLKDVYVTQYFGQNYLDFYKSWGLLGH
jgi:hypothetical protein